MLWKKRKQDTLSFIGMGFHILLGFQEERAKSKSVVFATLFRFRECFGFGDPLFRSEINVVELLMEAALYNATMLPLSS